VVAPIRLGSGTRLKVLEALARGKALVATSIAVEGLDIRPGVDFELADTPTQFSAACIRLLGAPEARRRLGDSGRRRVLERYTWDAVGEAAHRVIADLVASRRSGHHSTAAAAGEM
jgi:glycosyltransferase involved in cell wall biosynthesis